MPTQRIQSIDLLRALTMLLMIWVNDFWRLTDIPAWLQHMPADVDALGFSDVIFPAFLFIVGLAIPFATEARRRRGEGDREILAHIVLRALALIVMGFFMVNLESYSEVGARLSKSSWQLLMIVAFVLIWNAYEPERVSARVQRLLQAVGVLLLILLAALFSSDPSSNFTLMRPHWWGILGMIGWSYLLCATAQLFRGQSLLAMTAVWLFFSLFNIAAFAGWLEPLGFMQPYLWLIGDASMPAMTMAGCVIATLYQQRFSGGNDGRRFLLLLLVTGVLLLLAGLALRPAWGISKILATPAWTQLCTGISVLCFALFYGLADLRGYSLWPRLLLPAGVATLTCYLVPYVAYPLLQRLPVDLPPMLSSGAAGLLTSALFALAVVMLTGGLNRIGIRLKI